MLLHTTGDDQLMIFFVLFEWKYWMTFHASWIQILYINCVVCPWRDSYAVGSAFSVAEPASIY